MDQKASQSQHSMGENVRLSVSESYRNDSDESSVEKKLRTKLDPPRIYSIAVVIALMKHVSVFWL